MKSKILLIVAAAALLSLLPASLVLAADPEVPPEYAGMTNPFPWDDTDAQAAGMASYNKSCQGCHGAGGDSIATADFSAAEYAQRLEDKGDLLYWILTQGRRDVGMPGYAGSFSDDERWQMLNYMWALGKGVGAEAAAAAGPADPGGRITLTIPDEEAAAGEPFLVEGVLFGSDSRALAGATVTFLLSANFFMEGWMEIDDTVTNADGEYNVELTTRLSGDHELIARYGRVEAIAPLTLAAADHAFYMPEAGLHLPAPGDEVFLGPASAITPSEIGEAPTTGFRLPGGILSWVLLLVGAVALSWGTYMRVMYQIFRIPGRGAEGRDARMLPMIGLAALGFIGLVLVAMLVTGPQSNFHLVP
jgi:mono/diheme cytochrome c family protein